MQKIILSCFLIITVLCSCINIKVDYPKESFITSNHHQPVNTIIGDTSFIKKFGKVPDKNSDEKLIVKTHLEYVENLLRQKETKNLPAKLKANRIKNLNLLHEYWARGIFPNNYDYKTRRPCFIDKDGNICAVGYLVSKTGKKGIEQRINAKFKYSYIKQMKLPELSDWVKNSGLTLYEVATIQPGYPGPPSDHATIV